MFPVTLTHHLSPTPLRHSMLLAVVLLLTTGAAGAQSRPSRTVPGQEPFSGSVRVGEATGELLVLSLKEAVERGLKANLGVLLSRQTVRAAHAQREQSLSTLLPHVALSTPRSIFSSSMSERRKASSSPVCPR